MRKADQVLIPQIKASYNIIDLNHIFGRNADDPIRIAYDSLFENPDAKSEDIFEILGKKCGFSEGNVCNQREHFLMLVASIQTRHSKIVHVDSIYHQLFLNYKNWLEYVCQGFDPLQSPDEAFLASLQQGRFQCPVPERIFGIRHEIVEIALFFLLWGESSNLRFCPEVLCRIFHEMLHRLIAPLPPDDKMFLEMVQVKYYAKLCADFTADGKIPPKSSHADIRNYDDLNESLGWMVSLDGNNNPVVDDEVLKTYTEQLSYLHLFRNYHRMWSLILLMFYVSVIIAGCSTQWQCSGIDYTSVIIPLSANILLQEMVSVFLGEPITRSTLSSHHSGRLFLHGMARCMIKVMVFVMYLCLYIYRITIPFVVLAVLHLSLLVFWEFSFFLRGLKRKSNGLEIRLLDVLSLFLNSSAATDIPLHIKQPDSTVTFYNVLMWSVILGLKFFFGLFILILPLTKLGHAIANEIRKSGNDDVIEFATVDIPFRDMKGLRVLVPLWIIVFILYVVDFEAWYVVISSLSSSIIAIQRRVHEKSRTDINHETIRCIASTWAVLSGSQDNGLGINLSVATQVHSNDDIVLSSALESSEGTTLDGEQKCLEISKVHVSILSSNQLVFDEAKESHSPIFVEDSAASSVDGMPILSLGDSSRKWSEVLDTTTLETLSFALQWNDIVASMREEDIISDSQCDTLEFVLDTVKGVKYEETKLKDLMILFPAELAKSGVGNILSVLAVACAQTKNYTRLVETSRGGEQRRASITNADSFGSGSPHRTLRSPSFSALDGPILSVVGIQERILWDQIFSEKKFEHAPVAQVVLIVVSFFGIVFEDDDFNIAEFIFRTYESIARMNILSISNYVAGIFKFSLLPKLCNSIQNLLELAASLDEFNDVDARNELKSCFNKMCELLDAAILPIGGKKSELGDNEKEIRELLDPFLVRMEEWKVRCRQHIQDTGWAHAKKFKTHLRKLSRHYNMYITCDAPASGPNALSDEVWRRIDFYVNSSLHMGDMHENTMGTFRIGSALSRPAFGTLTPYYNETINFSVTELFAINSGNGIHQLKYLQSIYANDWNNFLERMCNSVFSRNQAELLMRLLAEAVEKEQVEGGRYDSQKHCDELFIDSVIAKVEKWAIDCNRFIEEMRLWASYRGQPLARTVRGMMYYERAIQTSYHIELCLAEPVKNFSYIRPQIQHRFNELILSKNEGQLETRVINWKSRKSELNALSAMKYTYVISAQIYAADSFPASKRRDILDIMRKYPSIRVAYMTCENKMHFSNLMKWDAKREEPVLIYKIALPGSAMIGEAKACNQNHALIFTRGEGVQAIDMNQDACLEDAFKMPALIGKLEYGVISGYREHVFTHDISSLARFMSSMEYSFVATSQRVLHSPLQLRMHYGHPDVFHKLTIMSCGGMAKASAKVNLSEDVFAGYNAALRGGKSTHEDFLQVNKGKDVGFQQITGFNFKITRGNAQQLLSRDVYRLTQQFDILRHVGFYYSHTGHFMNCVFSVMLSFVIVYFKIFMTYIEKEELFTDNLSNSSSARAVYTSIYATQVIQFFLLPVMASTISMVVEVGPVQAILNQVSMFFRGSVVFFAFQLEAKCAAFHETLTFGEAKYVATGRGFEINHQDFTLLYRSYFFSHILPGLEICFCLLLYRYMAGFDVDPSRNFGMEVFPLLVLGMSWVWAPFFFNPGAIDWVLAFDDWDKFKNWIFSQSVTDELSWEAWFASSLSNYANASTSKIFFYVFLWMLRKWMILIALLHLAYVSSLNTRMPLPGSIAVFGICLVIVTCIGVIAYAFTDRRLKTVDEITDEGPTTTVKDSRCKRVFKYAIGFTLVVLIGIVLITRVATVGEVWWLVLTVVVFLYLVINDIVFVMLYHIKTFSIWNWINLRQPTGERANGNKILRFDAFKEVVIFKYFVRMVHLACGIVILFPLLLFSILRPLSDFHNRILFSETFSRNLEVNKTVVHMKQKSV